MKRFVLMAIMAVMMMPLWAETPKNETKVVTQAAELVLRRAVSEGMITERQKSRFLRSGIIEEATRTLFATNFNVAASVDKAAEQAVRQGYFKSKAQAKRYLRQSIEQARKSRSFWQSLYRAMGI